MLSPILYGVFVNDLLQELDETNDGYKLFQHHVPALFYCDDMIITTDDPNKLLKLLKMCEAHSIKWQYKFNAAKCNLITHNVEHPFQEILEMQNPMRNA